MKNKNIRIRINIRFILFRVFFVLALVAVGIGFLSLAESISRLIFIGITYIIALLAFIIAVLLDIFDGEDWPLSLFSKA